MGEKKHLWQIFHGDWLESLEEPSSSTCLDLQMPFETD
jgi:hypothetical protein